MRSFHLLPLFLLWCILVWIAPSSVFWRDSGEFIIQAFTLDIAHPAGFPTYALIANALTLVPFGPIAWRVILVSSFCLVIVSLLLLALIRELNQNRSVSFGPFLLAILLLIAMLPLTIKQAQSAEVYLLNGVFLLGIALLLMRGIRLSDQRFLITAALIGGLAVGNHISAALSGVLVSGILIMTSALFRKAILPMTLCFMVGLLSYCYLPLRSSQPLSMNTGLPNTPTRLWQVLSDARDRELRPSATSEYADETLAGYEKLIPNPLNHLENDIKKIGLFNPIVFGVLSAASLLFCLISRPKAALIVMPIGLGNYLFFSGWDGDPWIVALTIMTVALVFTLQSINERIFVQSPKIQDMIIYSILALVIWRGDFKTLGEAVFELRNYETPAHYAQKWLGSSKAPVVITENSWFLARYLTDIEGVGDDRLIVYQPSLLFPSYFNPLNISLMSGDRFNSSLVGGGPKALGGFIESVAQSSPVLVEPSQAINQLITPIAVLQDSGAYEIAKGTYADSSRTDGFAEGERILKELSRGAQLAGSFIKGDTINFRDNLLSAHLDLWQKQGQELAALAMVDSICGDAKTKQCSVSIFNQRGLILLKLKKFDEAVDYYQGLLHAFPEAAGALTQNLALAEKQRDRSAEQHQTTNL